MTVFKEYKVDYLPFRTRVVSRANQLFLVQTSHDGEKWYTHLKNENTAFYSSKYTAINAAKRIFINQHKLITFRLVYSKRTEFVHWYKQAFNKQPVLCNGPSSYWDQWLMGSEQELITCKLAWV